MPHRVYARRAPIARRVGSEAQKNGRAHDEPCRLCSSESGSDQPPAPVVAAVVEPVVADVVLPVADVDDFVDEDVLLLVDEVVPLPPEPESSPQAATDIAIPVSTVNSPANFIKRVILSVFLPRLEPKPCSK